MFTRTFATPTVVRSGCHVIFAAWPNVSFVPCRVRAMPSTRTTGSAELEEDSGVDVDGELLRVLPALVPTLLGVAGLVGLVPAAAEVLDGPATGAEESSRHPARPSA